jgi:hypothetical protein
MRWRVSSTTQGSASFVTKGRKYETTKDCLLDLLPLFRVFVLSRFRDDKKANGDDLVAGRLGALLAEVDKEHGAGLARPL